MPHGRSLLALTLASLLATPSLAQQGPSPEQLDCVAALGDVAVRWDPETGTFASLTWAEAGDALFGPTPEQAVCSWLEQDLAPLLDAGVLAVVDADLVPPSGTALVHVATRDLGHERLRVDLQQYVGGVPVLTAGLHIEVVRAPDGPCPVAVRGRYLPGESWDLALPDAQVEAGLAARYPSFRDGGLEASTTWRQVVVPADDGFRLAFAVDVAPTPSTALQVLVDAETGEELGRSERCCNANATGLGFAKNPGDTPRAAAPLTDLYVYQGANRVTTDAKGDHPLTGMVSLDDALAGPLLRVFVDQELELTYTGPADFVLAPALTGSDQDEVAAWQHVTSYNRHLQQTYARFKDSVAATTRFALVVRFKEGGQPLANAFFSNQNVQAGGEAFTGYIGMGTFGSREAARSSSVVQHEYTHALLSEVVLLSGTLQSGGLNEGLSDYLPAAFKDDPLIGNWLTNPAIRDLRQNLRWPGDADDQVHRVGHIFAGALWDAREAAAQGDPADRLRIDQAVVEGIFRLRDQPTLMDAREAVLAGDAVANAGAFRVTLTEAFAAHGVGPAAVNDAPALVAVTADPVRVGETLSFSVVATDPDGDPVALSASPLENGVLVPATGAFVFTPAPGQEGLQQVTFTASDEVLADSQTVSITVLPELPPPAPATPAGGVAPVGSGATSPDPVAADRGGGGGGGGGCALGPQTQGSPLGLLLLLGLGLLLTARSRERACRG